MTNAAIIIAKGSSNRLPQKNYRDFAGKPMFHWVVERCLKVFDKTYVSSDLDLILNGAKELGAMPIKRGKELCGECPNIPVYLHAYERMDLKPDYIVSVQSNSPTIPLSTLKQFKWIMDSGQFQEAMTCFPDTRASEFANKGTTHEKYKNTHFKWCSGVWAMTKERLLNYGDPLEKKPEVLIRNNSIDIHTMEELELALEQHKERYEN